jgi:hypothetical protein
MYLNLPSKALCLIALAFVACEGAAVPQAPISFNDLSPEKERSPVSDNLPINCSQLISPDGKVNIAALAALAALDFPEPVSTAPSSRVIAFMRIRSDFSSLPP